jgi:hypothetical protein
MSLTLAFKAPPSTTITMALTPEDLLHLQDAIDDALAGVSDAASFAGLRRLQRRLHAKTGEELPPT